MRGKVLRGILEACYFKEGETLVIQGPFFAFVYNNICLLTGLVKVVEYFIIK